MKNFYVCFLLVAISIPLSLFSQIVNGKDGYTYQVREEKGDLNNDGKIDKVTVQMDTLDEKRPLRLQVFLSQANGKLTLAVSSNKIIEPQYPTENGGEYNGYQIPNFFIEDGILKMWSEIKRGNITYHFRYNEGNFELIYIEKHTSNAGKGYTDENTIFTETTFDLVKGIRIERDEKAGLSKPLEIRKKSVFVRPLPKYRISRILIKNYIKII